jgi:hypothetical protein
VEECVNTRSAKMKSVNTSLVVKMLILLYKLNKMGMCLLKLSTSDVPLCEYSDTTHKLAKVCPIFLRKYCSEDSRSKSKEVEVVLCCLESTRYFICWITWRAMEGGREKGCSISH